HVVDPAGSAHQRESSRRLQDRVVRLARRIGERRLNVIRLKVTKVPKDFLVRHPSASIPRISVTRMRIPRMHGRPPHLPGSTVMRLRSFMAAGYFSASSATSLQNSVWISPDPLEEEREILDGGKINVESLIPLEAGT